MLKLSQKISSKVLKNAYNISMAYTSKKLASNVCIVDNPYTQEVIIIINS